MVDCSAKHSADVIVDTPFWDVLFLTLLWTTSAFAMQAKNTSRIPGLLGSKTNSRLDAHTMLKSIGGRLGTAKMLARDWG